MATIFTSLSPNTEKDDVWLAFTLLFQPWKWRRGGAVRELERRFAAWLPARSAFAFASGRTALYAILSCLEFEPTDEVLLQAYTCVAVPDPVLWAGLKPVYVDIKPESLTMDPADLERKITANSKALIIQHTFGQPAELRRLLAIAEKHDLFVIEDCAHALGTEYQGNKLGTFGDAAFFSFGRDKVISSVFGGMATTDDEALAEDLREIQASFAPPSFLWTKRQLLHPLILGLAKTFYGFFGLGKVILALAMKLRILSRAVQPIERRGGMPSFGEQAMPNALALLALHQFTKLDRLNTRRLAICRRYHQAFRGLGVGLPGATLPYLRYTLRTPRVTHLTRQAKAKKILLGDWYTTAIAPRGVDDKAIRYHGDCPVAERLAGETINLPTHIQMTDRDVDRVIDCVTSALQT